MSKEQIDELTEEENFEETELEGLTEEQKERLESFESVAIPAENFESATMELKSSGWIESVIKDLKFLKETTKGKTVFKLSYDNFCRRYYGDKKFSSTGNSVRTAIAKRFELDNKEAKAIVPYLNGKKDNDDRFNGKLAIDYMSLTL